MVIKSIPINKKTNLSPKTRGDIWSEQYRDSQTLSRHEQVDNLLRIAIAEKAEYPRRERDIKNAKEYIADGKYESVIHSLKTIITRQRDITHAAHDELSALMGEL